MLMWQKLSLLLVLYSLPSCSTEITYYVTPTPDTQCPGEPCHTLSQYAEYDFKNFSSNTTLVFLPGDHTLNHTISFGLTDTLSNWRNTTHHHYPYHSLTLLGSPAPLPEATSRIVCTRSAGFAFSGITELHITGLAFILCGHGPAVNIWSVLNSSIVNCTFQNNNCRQWQDGGHSDGENYEHIDEKDDEYNGKKGVVILANNSTLTLTGCKIQNNRGYYRGAVFAMDSILTFTENIFQNNTAENGGALFIHKNNILRLTHNMFQNNVAKYSEGGGGALFAVENNTLIFVENVFQNNLARFGGGGLCVLQNNTLIIIENLFQDNLASYAGGALHCGQENTVILTKNVFQKNMGGDSGGILYVDVKNTLTLTGNLFQNNSANIEHGGVLYVHTSNTLTLKGNTFQNSSPAGVLYVGINNTLTITENSFQNNSAKIAGGVLYVYANNILTLTGNTFQNSSPAGVLYVGINNTLTITENSFQNNSAKKAGGVLYVLTNNTLTLTGNSFQNNSAKKAGGVLYVILNNTLTLTGNTFQNNSAIESGGVLYVHTNNILTLTGNTFQNNSANFDGGVVDIYTYNVLTLFGNTFQNNFVGRNGGAFSTINNNILTITQCIFQSNSANEFGGALTVVRVTQSLILENNTFQNNLAGSGGALHVTCSNIVVTENTFQHNSANNSGGVLNIHNSTSIIIKNTFQNNDASLSGGCLFSINTTITFTENILLNNGAVIGGALSVFQNSTLIIVRNGFHNNDALNGGVLSTHESIIELKNNNFSNNKAQLMGGVVFCIASSNLSIQSQHRFWNNTAQYGGGVAAMDCQVTLAGITSFENNTATYGGGLYADGLRLHISGWTNFINNSATKDGGGAYASRSVLSTEQGVTFQGNSALNNGGGMMLTGGSKIWLYPNTSFNFTSNSAKQKGGALMIQESNSLSFCAELSCEFLTGTDCFFQIQTHAKYNTRTPISEIIELHSIRFYFNNNTALEAGATLYGSSIDYCKLTCVSQVQGRHFMHIPYECPISGKIFENITSHEHLDISSDPLYICTCLDNETVCSNSATTMTVYPGGIITVPVLAHGQRNGTTPAVIRNITPKGSLSFNDLEITQNIPARCTSLKYTVRTRAEDTFQQIRLYAEGPCPPREGTTLATPTNLLTIHFEVAQCPPGFELSDTQPTCICTQRLRPFTSECQINNRSIKRDSEFWMGYTDDKRLILHSHCPFDYCSLNTMYLAVDNSDKQCSNNRSGLLCGQCSQTFSLALGTSRCLQCSDNYLWLLLAFAFAGLLLVLLLLILNLTVAAGTINGLVFYANVLAVNSATFLQPHTTNILTVFIAWINLDLGIETCFYDGMDTYAKTWLQFVFPLYVWGLVMAIIFVSHYSIRISAILSNSTVAVLATLILLSYTKILRTIIAALSHTLLEYPNNSQVAVWLLDGNIGYLSSKHIPLFIAALGFLIFLFLPYTLVLLFGQWTRKSRLKIFSPINNYRIVFFLEAYHAPYTEKHRYWTGLMLTLRCLLFLVFAFNTFGNPNINLLCISLASTVLQLFITLLGNRVYKSVLTNILELSFNSNLSIVAVATFYVRSTGGNQNAVTFTSISAAFVTFLGIVVYHLVQQIKAALQWWRRLHPTQGYNADRLAVADSGPQDRALTRPSTAQFATVAYININDIVRAHLAESHA